MLKRIPKSDISIRPFKAYKEWSFTNYDSGSITVLQANENLSDLNLISTGSLTGSLYPKNSIYGQLRAQFYNGNEDNPINRTGNKTNVYNNSFLTKERYLSGSAKVISIPQIYVGEGIKKGSVRLLDYSFYNTIDPYVDDFYGNLVSETGLNELHFTTMSLLESQSVFYFNSSNDSFTASIDFMGTPPVMFVDMEAAQIELVINGVLHTADVVSIDLELGNIYVKNTDFLPGQTIGNIFYNQGLVVLTRNLNLILDYNWELSFKSTKTIYENEYLLIVNQDEFNVSTNPSAVVNIGKETNFVTGSDGKIKQVVTNPGVSYIRKLTELSNGDILDYRYSGSIGNNIKGGFEQAYVSSSIDTTGSFLTPMITTIGLYDDDCQLVAVAKLPQPIKSEHDMPVNFIVRFDT